MWSAPDIEMLCEGHSATVYLGSGITMGFISLYLASYPLNPLLVAGTLEMLCAMLELSLAISGHFIHAVA